jgi:dihydropteroate synthase
MGLVTIELRSARFDWSRVYVAGVLNVTPDSFSDGGSYLDLDTAVAHARELVRAGADLIDVGGESTRPGASAVDESTERARVLPVVRALAQELRVPVSVDTTKASMARAALAAGAEIINDISGGRFDAELPAVVADAGAVYICGHVRGSNVREAHATEGAPPGFEEVVAELAERLAAMPAALRDRVVIDPGLGFGKRTPQNLELLRRAGELGARLSCPVMVGPSRKRFVAELTGDHGREMDTALRDRGTVGACLAAAASGAQLVRTHDVAQLVPALRVFEAVTRPGGAS